MRLWRLFLAVLGVLSAIGGVRHAMALRDALEPASSFAQAGGTVLAVEKHTLSGDGPPQHFAEIRFEYKVDGQRHTGHRTLPVCDACTPEVVHRILGVRPSQIPPGMPVTVQVLRRDPRVAYLALATRDDKVESAWQVVLWLIGVPVFAFLLGRLGAGGAGG
jgi:hypothetical protein